MIERPISLPGPSVRAILDGRKTQTRQLTGLDTLKPSDTPGYDWTFRGRAPMRTIAQQARRPLGCWQNITAAQFLTLCPYGVSGDLLWVREAWAVPHALDPMKPSETFGDAKLHYAATEERGGLLWRSPIHMPRWASRITLRVTDVRVQRLQEISEEDAKAEGCRDFFEEFPQIWGDQRLTCGALARDAPYRAGFAVLWDSINHKRAPWASNPWVWVINFERLL